MAAVGPFAALLAAGLTTVIGIQALVILGGTLKLMPLTGVTLPLLTIFTGIQWQGAPLIERQLGRAAMSRQIIAIAHAQGNPPILADNRSVLADLFYTGQSEGLAYYAPRPQGRAQNHYEQRYPLPANLTGPLLWITRTAPACATATYALDATASAYRKSGLAAYLVPAECANAEQ